MIRPDTREIAHVIEIAIKTAPNYALRAAMSPRGKLNRQVAVETLTARVIAALRPYEITREPNSYELGADTLPLFPDDMRHPRPTESRERASRWGAAHDEQ